MKRKISTLDNISSKGLEVFGQKYDKIDDLNKAQAWIIRSSDLHSKAFPDDLRAIGRAGAGTNNIPLDVCSEKGIVVFNAPGANANAVTELAIAMLLLSSRNIYGGINWVKENSDQENIGKVAEKAKKQFVGNEIRGKTLGIIGLGAIGHMLANSASGLGINVIAYDPGIRIEYALRLSTNVCLAESLEDVLSQADFISIHIPLSDKTEKFISKKELAQMKKGAVLLNFSRDKICDEVEVGHFLESRHLGRYIVDFPNDTNTKFKNTIITPHLGGSSHEAEVNCAVSVCSSVKTYLETANIQNSVNYPNLSLGQMTSKTRILVLHKNKPNLITKMTKRLGDQGYNIIKMVSDSRGEYAAVIIDLDDLIERSFIMELQNHPDILRVRVLYKEDK